MVSNFAAIRSSFAAAIAAPQPRSLDLDDVFIHLLHAISLDARRISARCRGTVLRRR